MSLKRFDVKIIRPFLSGLSLSVRLLQRFPERDTNYYSTVAVMCNECMLQLIKQHPSNSLTLNVTPAMLLLDLWFCVYIGVKIMHIRLGLSLTLILPLPKLLKAGFHSGKFSSGRIGKLPLFKSH